MSRLDNCRATPRPATPPDHRNRGRAGATLDPMALTNHAATVDDVIDAWNDSLFGALPKPLGQALFEASRVEVFDPGDIVLRGADPHAFVIVDGLVRVYMRGRDGRQATIRYAMQGD